MCFEDYGLDYTNFSLFQVIESKGPTNTRVYTVAVYFKGERLAKAEGPSIQTAEMNAAKIALDTCGHLFPHLDYQKKIVERSLRKNKDHMKQSWEEEVRRVRKERGLDEINDECSKRNDERLKKILRRPSNNEPPQASLQSNSKVPPPNSCQSYSKASAPNPPTPPTPAMIKTNTPKTTPKAKPIVTPPPPPEKKPAEVVSQPKKKAKPVVKSDEPKEEGECSDDSDEDDEN